MSFQKKGYDRTRDGMDADRPEARTLSGNWGEDAYGFWWEVNKPGAPVWVLGVFPGAPVDKAEGV